MFLVLLLAGPVTVWASARSRAAGATPDSVVGAYISALDRHDGRAVCSLFARQLRPFEIKWDEPGTGRTSCARTVAAHFDSYYSRHRWAGARARGPMRTTEDPQTGVTAVRFMLAERYRCARQSSPPEPCRPSVYVRPEIVYLIRVAHDWKIIKPGDVYESTGIAQPFFAESDYYPPGNAATVAGSVSVPPSTITCPTGGAVAVSPAHKLQSTFEPNPNGKPGNAPGLTIEALTISRISKHTICFALTLAGPPRPDDAYSIYVGAVQQEGAADLFDVEFDGLGDPHPLLGGRGALSTPSIRSRLPHVAVYGDLLQIIGSDSEFAHLKRFLVQAGTASIQDDEPLLRRPVDAGDTSPLAGCLAFPTGRIDMRGLCGETSMG